MPTDELADLFLLSGVALVIAGVAGYVVRILLAVWG